METESVCPWWMGYLLINPIRKYQHNPKELLGNYVKKGMTVIDYGSAMGYFSLPMAEMVGDKGKVYCFDIQRKMLEKLIDRARKNGLDKQIEPILVTKERTFVGISGQADFILLFAVAHEVPDQEALFQYLGLMMKKDSFLLFAEPPGHVSKTAFERSIALAEKSGFKRSENQSLNKKLMVLLQKQ